MAEALEELWPENKDAWTVMQACLSRFHVDTHSTPMALEAACDGRDPDERLDLFQRLSVMYTILYPPPDPKA